MRLRRKPTIPPESGLFELSRLIDAKTHRAKELHTALGKTVGNYVEVFTPEGTIEPFQVGAERDISNPWTENYGRRRYTAAFERFSSTTVGVGVNLPVEQSVLMSFTMDGARGERGEVERFASVSSGVYHGEPVKLINRWPGKSGDILSLAEFHESIDYMRHVLANADVVVMPVPEPGDNGPNQPFLKLDC
jgi:hypothetical protein